MRILIVKRAGANIQALEENLRAHLGENYLGLSTTPGEVRVHLREVISADDEQSAQNIVAAHDPAQLTPAQQAEVERQRQLLLLRAGSGTPLNPAQYDTAESIIQHLAAKVRWLEHEIRDLRGMR